MIDRFQYNYDVPAEDIEFYCPGGYHPTHLNDLLKGGQYQILHKLGFGSFATVWLARDNRNQRNVSIKIIMASKSETNNRELQILQTLAATGNSDHSGRKHVSQLLDWFYHDGPNGRHLCMVLNLLGPSVSAVAERCPNYRLDGNLARRVSRQLLYATDYLHSCGVAHGDIHMGNVLFCLVDLESSSSQSAIEELGTPLRGEVSRIDGAPLEKGLPEYLVEPVDYEARNGKMNGKSLDEIQLVDFGEAFFISNPPKLINTPISLHPPELVFQHILSEAVDIWNLGSTTYELVIGRPPFEAFFDDKDLVSQFQKVIGGVPEKWVQDALSNGVLKEGINDSSDDCFLPLEQRIRRAYFDGYKTDTLQFGEEELELLGRYLRKMLIVDPKQRATSQDLLGETWISEAR